MLRDFGDLALGAARARITIRLLQGVGATAEVANDGREAVRKLLGQRMPPNYEVVLMDLQMPEMDGYHLP